MHFSFCAAHGNMDRKRCYHRTAVRLYVDHKKGTEWCSVVWNISKCIHPSEWLYLRTSPQWICCAGECMGDTTKWETQLSTDLIRLVITLQQQWKAYSSNPSSASPYSTLSKPRHQLFYTISSSGLKLQNSLCLTRVFCWHVCWLSNPLPSLFGFTMSLITGRVRLMQYKRHEHFEGNMQGFKSAE